LIKADDRQLFYGDLAGMKTKRPTVESNYNHYEGDEYQPINDYKKPAYYEVPPISILKLHHYQIFLHDFND